MRLHPREELVRDSRLELMNRLADWNEKHTEELTEVEWIQIITSCFSWEMSTFCKFAIREERHGDADKPGGLE